MEILNPVEVRVLGALIEKEAATPEYYPLSLNALVNACNQKTNRDPVVEYDESDVRDAIEGLRAKGMAFVIEGSRVAKFSQRISETYNLGRRELAVLGVLLLRGPQTLGEIKDRSERLFSFGDLQEAENVLDRLAERADGALVQKLERQPGQKEVRFVHLLAGPPSAEILIPAPSADRPSRVEQLEETVNQMRADLDALTARFEALEAQLR